MAGPVASAPNQAEREKFYAKVEARDLSPLWTRTLVQSVPRLFIKARPHHWDFDNVLRPLLLEAGGLITAQEANRRVLSLENPGLQGGAPRILESLYAGLQMILPGECAPAHRHTPSALRFIMQGKGAWTAVQGERSFMEPGDFIITPSMTWHNHGHDGDDPFFWMDGLDIPMVAAFGPMFFEAYPDDRAPQSRAPGDSSARYGANMRPVTGKWERPESPVFHYPYARSREALETLRRNGELDPYDGVKLEYIDPVRGGSAMPTISAFLQLLPKGFSGEVYRTTENIVFSAVEGRGRLIAGESGLEKTIEWKPRDIFAMPCWVPFRLEAEGGDACLFSYSDRVAQHKLALWREQRGNALQD